MPIYEYQCTKCGQVFDKFVRSISAQEQVECPECHSKECRKNVTTFGTVGSSAGFGAASGCAPTGG